jgi:hypothetical protein
MRRSGCGAPDDVSARNFLMGRLLRAMAVGATVGAGFGALIAGDCEAEAQAAGTAIKFDRMAAPPVIDGLPSEWPRPLTPLKVTTGTAGADLTAKGAVGYDDRLVYVSVDVTDDKLVPDGDRVELVIGFSGGATSTVTLYPGGPGKPARATAGSGAIAGAKVVEAPRKGGWTLEAQFPWSALSGPPNVRVGLRGALIVRDADASATPDGSASNAGGTGWDRLPSMPTTPEQDLNESLVIPKRLGAPTANVLADVVGDGMKERVLVYGSYLVVLGPTYRGGKEYYWNDMSIAGRTFVSATCEARDVDGDGKDDLVMKKRFTEGTATRELLHVLTFGRSETPNIAFQHEVGLTSGGGSITNDVRWGTDKGKSTITITPGTAKGVDETTLRDKPEGGEGGVLLPWGPIELQRYAWKTTGFEKVEEKRKSGAAPRPKETSAPRPSAAPPPPPPGADLPKVVDLFKKERKASGSPRFDLSGDMVGDAKNERALVYDRDLLIIGPAYKGGKGYSYSTLPFAAADDIKNVLIRDTTGDAKQELIVRGLLKARASGDAGGGEVERTIELVYQVGPDSLKRVFGAEVGRAIGSKSITATIGYQIQKGKGQIILGTGKATGWTQANYPFNEEKGPSGGLEPLLLPWASTRSITYAWNGGAFAR